MKRWLTVLSFLFILIFIQGCDSTSPDNEIFDINKCAREIDTQVEVTLNEKIGDFACAYGANQISDAKYGEVWEANNGCTYVIHTKSIMGRTNLGLINPEDEFWSEIIHFETMIDGKLNGFVKEENIQYCEFEMNKDPRVKDCFFDKTYERQKCRVLEASSEFSVEQGWH